MWRGSQYFSYICSRKRVKQIGGRLVTFPFVKEKNNNNNINKPRGLHSRPVQWKKLFIRTIKFMLLSLTTSLSLLLPVCHLL